MGFFGYEKNTEVQAAEQGTCVWAKDGPFGYRKGDTVSGGLNREACGLNAPDYEWIPAGATAPIPALTRYDQCLADGGTAESCKQYSGAPTKPTEGGYLDNVGCTANPTTWFNGCVVKFFQLFFVVIPSGALWFAAWFFNSLIYIVIQSSIYGDPFIAGAWVVVRDLSNIFFILILLYVGIKTVLNMGGHETKSMITSVIIMALLINFSLFFTRIVIDSSNILALIFYNQLDVRYKDANGDMVDRPNPHKGKDIAGAMYEKFNATKLITEDLINEIKKHSISKTAGTPPARTTNQESSVISTLSPKTAEAVVVAPWLIYVGGASLVGSAITAYNYVFPSDIPVGPVTLLMLIAGLIMLVSAYVLFSSGIFFIGRIIELWLLMIFSPFAFMSFAVPKLSHTEYGWEKWLEKLISSSFMVSIFMFFLYLIFKIMESGIFKGLGGVSGTTVVGAIISVVLPAFIILGMLLKAKDLAKKGGGQFGEMVMTGVKVAGGLAIGGAALGTAAAGRKVIGGAAASFSNRENAISHGEALFKHSKELDTWEQQTKEWKKAGGLGAAPVRPAEPPKPPKFGMRDYVGARINQSQLKSGEISHGRHEKDELKKAAGVESLDDDQLSGVDIKNMQSAYLKKNLSAIKAEIREGYDAKGNVINVPVDIDIGGGVIATTNATGEKDYMAKRRQTVTESLRNDPSVQRNGQVDNDLLRKKAEDQMSAEFNQKSKDKLPEVAKERYEHIEHEAKQKIGLGTSLLAKSTSSSYDIRDLADIKTDKREGLTAKATFGIIAAIATGMRMGLKQGAGVNSGTPQRAVFKDVGEVITQAFKGANFNLDFKSGGGGSHGKDDHGTSGGGHH